MAGEFGVPFLGNVPIDPLWGILVEEGKRPRYDDVVAEQLAKKAEAEDDEDDKDDDDIAHDLAESSIREVVREGGLLVDKYRNCSLCPSFAGIAYQLVERAESGTAIAVSKV